MNPDDGSGDDGLSGDSAGETEVNPVPGPGAMTESTANGESTGNEDVVDGAEDSDQTNAINQIDNLSAHHSKRRAYSVKKRCQRIPRR